MLIIGLLVGCAYAFGGFAKPVDAVAYWEAGTSTHLYPEHWSEVAGGYLFYPPPVAQLSALLQPIGWELFVVLLTVATFGAFWYCARSASLPLLLIGIPFYLGVGPREPATFLDYALLGNLQWVLAALVVVSMRHSSAMPVLAFSKVTTGIGWLWPLVRGEWRAAAVGAAACLACLAISFATAPTLWFDFAAFASRNAAMSDPPLPLFPIPFGVRVAMSVGLVVWGAATNRTWTVPVAAGWALPALYGWGFLPFWVAAVRLTDIDRSRVTGWALSAVATAREVVPARPALRQPDPAPVLVEVVSD